ncbi:hypothetical protein AMD27_09945 [Acinetobacter sp. TGL-Y2]|uniref:DUF4951 domain-containing protein n=1 Tax=Acinetobacter sp. TGL-Y2 TaxID=1407071 RepID=UPI0007A66A17|nr:DUF4951 domain-containing protein [Acinetobacter sp. TGL-Y2]AMW80392.1 hypothetical protein AMD27_09945 [Acinetobacter sp. TGL-Y2]
MPNAADYVRDPNCKVNESIERNPIPKTPQNMSLPLFGQGVIGWETGPEGAEARLKNIQKADLKAIQDKGTTLEMVKEWQAFYENETLRNPCNPTAPYRAKLMKKIAQLWVD